jgi:hypothetical protein
MIEQARLYQDTLEELYAKERPTLGGTIHPDHGRDLQTLPSQSRYQKEILAVKGASGVAKTNDFKFRNNVETQPPPAPAPSNDARAGCVTMARGDATAANPAPVPATLPKACTRKGNEYACAL